MAFPWRLYGIPDKEQRQSDLAVSRDGVNWTFFDDPYMPYGIEFEGDSVIESLVMDGLVRRGDELWQYAELTFTGHKGGQFEEKPARNVMMRYKQRLDGFVAMESGEIPGWARTHAFRFEGDRLELNVVARGEVRVALLDAQGAELPGFSIAQCDPIKADSVRHLVSWEGRTDVSRLAGQPVRLQFEMENAKVYAFQFKAP